MFSPPVQQDHPSLWMLECFVPGEGKATKALAGQVRGLVMQECFKLQGDEIVGPEAVAQIPGMGCAGFRIALKTRGLTTSTNRSWPLMMSRYLHDMATREHIETVILGVVVDLANANHQHIYLSCPGHEMQELVHVQLNDFLPVGAMDFSHASTLSTWDAMLGFVDMEKAQAAFQALTLTGATPPALGRGKPRL